MGSRKVFLRGSSGITKCRGQVVPITPRGAVIPDIGRRIIKLVSTDHRGDRFRSQKSRGEACLAMPETQVFEQVLPPGCPIGGRRLQDCDRDVPNGRRQRFPHE